MATRLKNLRLTKVDLVDEGANQHAHVRLTKRDDEERREAESGAPEIVSVTVDVALMTEDERRTFMDLADRYGAEAVDAADGGVMKGLRIENVTLQQQLRKAKDQLQRRELMEVAKKYEPLGRDEESLVNTLGQMMRAGAEVYEAYLSELDEQLELTKRSGLFTELGKRGRSAAGDPWYRIEQCADELRQMTPGMPRHDAIVRACRENPELVREYEQARI